MQMSKAYEKLVELIKSSDSRKADMYSTGLFDRLDDSEVEKAEDLIWETFQKEHDTGLLIFFPKLKKYDGISALRKLVNDYEIPSHLNMMIASLLYDNTKEIYYLELMEKNIIKSQYDYPYVASMIHSEPCEEIYRVLVRIYMKCPEGIALTSCTDGILYNKGFISDLNDYHQLITTKEIANILRKAPMNERKAMIEKLEKGEFDQYKSNE